jgi:hypothetical protein
VAALVALAGSGHAGVLSVSAAAARDDMQRTAFRSVAAPMQPTIEVTTASPGPTVSRDLRGANLATHLALPNPSDALGMFASSGLTLVRWPGGQDADKYHWATPVGSPTDWDPSNWNTSQQFGCSSAAPDGQPGMTPNPSYDFDSFMQAAQAASVDVAVTLNYGSNLACNGPGDPNEAAAWVAYAKSKNYPVKFWTVGNEPYSNSAEYYLPTAGTTWPLTRNQLAAIYANTVGCLGSGGPPGTSGPPGAGGYYDAIKRADPTAQVGVDVFEPTDGANPRYWDTNWNNIVLTNACYDFVEVHYYAPGNATVSDQTMLYNDAGYAPTFTATINHVKAALAAGRYGNPNIPIYVGELNSSGPPIQRDGSITNALFAAGMVGEAMNDGIAALSWWNGFAPCRPSPLTQANLFSSDNYQTFSLFSSGPASALQCPAPVGAAYPVAQLFSLLAPEVVDGAQAFPVQLNPTLRNRYLRAYAVRDGTSYAVIVINVNKTSSVLGAVGVDSLPAGSSATIQYYDVGQYCQSNYGSMVGPATSTPTCTPTGNTIVGPTPVKSLGPWNGFVPVNLTPWSVTVITLNP